MTKKNNYRLGILGSGFGLYGYLPSAVLSGYGRVYLAKKTLAAYKKRNELQEFTEKIVWLKNEASIINKCDTIIIAKRPDQQIYWVAKILKKRKVKAVLLEKPIAKNPRSAKKLISKLFNWNGKMRIAYLFPFMEWGKYFFSECRKKNTLKVKVCWNFMAHHFANNLSNWKQCHEKGGGPLRFYGIHLIALLAWAGYKTPQSSVLTHTKWNALYCKKKLATVCISINTKAKKNIFSIAVYKKDTLKNLKLKSPFESKKDNNNFDHRVLYLHRLIKTLSHNNKKNTYTFYQKTVNLWDNTEKITLHDNK